MKGPAAWTDERMAALDRRARVVATRLGPVQVATAGDGPEVLVVHGSPGGHDQGLAWAGHLLDAGCRLVAPSRPGYLRTPLDAGRSPAAQADLLAALLDSLGIDRVGVLGLSSGGPASVHFAAQHPERTTALFLDAAVLDRLTPSLDLVQRTVFATSAGTRVSVAVAARWPRSGAAAGVASLSAGLTRAERRAATEWIVADERRLARFVALSASVAPWRYRRPGLRLDEANEAELAPLPFGDVTAPTVIAQGTADAFPLLPHARLAAGAIDRAELHLLDGAHHALPWCVGYESVARRRLALLGV